MKLNICWFLPLPAAIIAQVKGYCEARGLKVNTINVLSSDEQYDLLESGKADAAVTAMDNVFHWNLRGQVEDLRVMAQVERTTQSVLMSAPNVRSIEDVRGGELIVDAPDNGFVVVTRAMLREAGLKPGDYKLSVVGGVIARVDALCSGAGEAALLVPIFEHRILEAGGHVLGRIDDYFPDYPGQGLVSRTSRWESLGPALSAWLNALHEAGEWIAGHASEARHLIADETGLPDQAVDSLLNAVPTIFRPSPEALNLVVSQRKDLDMPGADGGVFALFDPCLTNPAD